VRRRGQGGYTLLHEAAEQGHLEIVTALLASGANVHARTTVRGRDTVRDTVRETQWETQRVHAAARGGGARPPGDRHAPTCTPGPRSVGAWGDGG
jgi:hypothetical protein